MPPPPRLARRWATGASFSSSTTPGASRICAPSCKAGATPRGSSPRAATTFCPQKRSASKWTPWRRTRRWRFCPADLPKDQTAAQTQALAALAQRLGEWAQLLKLVNGFLRDRVVTNHEPLHRAIAGVNKRLDLKGLTAFDARNEAARTNAIAKTIGVSLDLLDEDERARFAELAVFPEDVDVPLGVVARLWSETGGLDEIDTEDLLRRLQSLSLLLSLDLDRRTFRFHDTVRHFLQDRAGKDALAALHKRLLKALDGIDARRTRTKPRAAIIFFTGPRIWTAAGERAALDALLLDPAWLQAKLEATR